VIEFLAFSVNSYCIIIACVVKHVMLYVLIFCSRPYNVCLVTV